MIDIANIVEEFIAETGMAPSTFGRKALGDKNVVKRLRDGKDVTTRTARKLLDFIETNRNPEAT